MEPVQEVAEQSAAQTPSPVHLARCQECAVSVKYHLDEDGDIADGCSHPGCDCGFDSRGDTSSERGAVASGQEDAVAACPTPSEAPGDKGLPVCAAEQTAGNSEARQPLSVKPPTDAPSSSELEHVPAFGTEEWYQWEIRRLTSTLSRLEQEKAEAMRERDLERCRFASWAESFQGLTIQIDTMPGEWGHLRAVVAARLVSAAKEFNRYAQGASSPNNFRKRAEAAEAQLTEAQQTIGALRARFDKLKTAFNENETLTNSLIQQLEAAEAKVAQLEAARGERG